MTTRVRALALGALGAIVAAGCFGAGAPPRPSEASRPVGALPTGQAAARLDVRRFEGKPSLTVVTRDGDPLPALVVAIAVDAGPIASAALSALVEGRLRAAGFDVDARADRASFRVRWAAADPGRAGAYLDALAASFAAAVSPSAPELAGVARRVRALKEQPIDAPELAAIASCTGEIASTPADVDAAVDATGVPRALEEWRRATLHAGRAALGAVGPAAFGSALAAALERSKAWPTGAAAEDPWPAADGVAVFASSNVQRRAARLTIAVRTSDPAGAVVAAERLGRAGSSLSLRLGALAQPWRAVAISGTARPRGGCVAVTLESARLPAAVGVEGSASVAGAIASREIGAELAVGAPPGVAARQILAATDPREAAARAAWWALSGAVPGAASRTAIALGVSAAERAGVELEPTRRRLEEEIARAFATPALDRRVALERGQGELWMLLASTCGAADEGTQDAGTSALAVLAAVASRRPSDVMIEPWITPDGVGVFAHAAPLDEHEAPAALARRVADEAALVLTATELDGDALAAARSIALRQLERAEGARGALLDAFLTAASPEHASWLEPLGPWTRAANASLDAVRLRRTALAASPLRVAVLAPSDAAQGTAVGDAIARWLVPPVAATACRPGPAPLPRPGRYDAKLPAETPIAEALIGVAVPPVGVTGHELAELAARALDAEAGALASAVAQTPGARASARLVGGTRAAALVIALRAPVDALDKATADVRSAMARLGQTIADADLARAVDAVDKQRRAGLFDPRARLVDLWRGSAPKRPAASLAAFRDWLGTTLREPQHIVVEARPE